MSSINVALIKATFRSYFRCEAPPALHLKPILLLEEADYISQRKPFPEDTILQDTKRLNTSITNRSKNANLNSVKKAPYFLALNSRNLVKENYVDDKKTSTLKNSKLEQQSTTPISYDVQDINGEGDYIYNLASDTGDNENFSLLQHKAKILTADDDSENNPKTSFLIQKVSLFQDKAANRVNISAPSAPVQRFLKISEQNPAATRYAETIPSPTTSLSAPLTQYEAMKLVITERAEDSYERNSSAKPVSNYLRSKELWLFKGDSSHGIKKKQNSNEKAENKKMHQSVLICASILTASLGISLIISGYVLARNISNQYSRSKRDYRCASYWTRRDSGEQGDCLAENLVVSCEDSETGSISAISDHNQGLSNRLYLLLQRDSSTGITPETLPDPNNSSANSQTLQVTQLSNLSSCVM